ncbi:hypothetical protein LXL04_018827 [Taraxacum kok-saghyz]
MPPISNKRGLQMSKRLQAGRHGSMSSGGKTFPADPSSHSLTSPTSHDHLGPARTTTGVDSSPRSSLVLADADSLPLFGVCSRPPLPSPRLNDVQVNGRKSDRCFRNPVTSAFFNCVKVLPVSRGEGIYQKEIVTITLCRSVDGEHQVIHEDGEHQVIQDHETNNVNNVVQNYPFIISLFVICQLELPLLRLEEQCSFCHWKMITPFRLCGMGTTRRGRRRCGEPATRKWAWNTAPAMAFFRWRASAWERKHRATRREAPFRPLNGSCCLIRCKKLEESVDVKKQTVFFLQTADVWTTSSSAELCRCGLKTANLLGLVVGIWESHLYDHIELGYLLSLAPPNVGFWSNSSSTINPISVSYANNMKWQTLLVESPILALPYGD